MAKRRRRWFGVKSVYRQEVTGEPTFTDELYAPGGNLVEERVVIVRARSHKAALRKARREAKKYSRASYVNAYGQPVTCRRLKKTVSFWMFEKPGQLKEVWSDIRLVPEATPDEALNEIFFGPDETDESLERRKIYFPT